MIENGDFWTNWAFLEQNKARIIIYGSKLVKKVYISTLNNCEQVSLMSELGFMKYLVSNKVL